MSYFLEKLLIMPGILLAFVIHGYACAYTSDKLGDPSPRNMGKLNLSPFAHIDPIGFILILLTGFGWTKPIFTDSRYYKNPKRGEILVALSGSIGNFLLAFVFLIFYKTMLSYKLYNSFTSPLILIVHSIISINISLGVFSLLPIYPLNGFKILETLIGDKHYSVVSFLQQYGFYMLLLLILTQIINVIVSIPSSIILWIMELIIATPIVLFKFIKKL